MNLKLAGALAAAALTLPASALADEGMWTFDAFPAARVEQSLGVRIDQKWLDRVQAASVRLTSGCSASLVSPDGLVLTNHHCVVDCAQNLSSGGTDYVKNSFLARTRAEERTCPGVQAEILLSIADVSADIAKATSGLSGDDFNKARNAAYARLESEACGKDPQTRCQIISFYRGGQHKLYRYRKYSDVRLVFAPELSAAFFGGDPDNFNFPRYALDVSFLRLYENGKAVRTPQHLSWKARAPLPGEATFVSGNPGSTDRLLTVAQLETQRDLILPIGQLQRAELRGRLIEFSRRDAESRRIATDALFGVENSFKALFGQQSALNTPSLMDAKRAEEADLRARVAADPALANRIGDPWSEIAALQQVTADQFLRFRQLEAASGGNSELFDYAQILVRAARERTLPNTQRLPAYADARLPLLEKQLLDASPVDPALEQLELEFWLLKTREYLTADDPVTRLLLGRESPEALSQALVSGSKLGDPAVRKALWEGGEAAVAASDDPMIRYALKIDAEARAVRKAWETQVSAPTEAAAARIASARFAVYGDKVYPDATFSLRLSYGKVAGWTWRGREVPPTTTLAGLYERATGAEPFRVADRWLAARDRMNLDAVFNFVTTNDIVGGNSGSPVISAKGEILGAAFDGNIHSLGGNYGYDGTLNRTVVVSAAGATEALRHVYGADALVRELGVR
ncbi:MAG: S46 family peptidase [Alphaproteobacteria bacterium]|uniref:S46 family peptidase n=1 Tax=Phenylobacterium sp. TaxID=1871053 RepID=UPI0025D1EB6A|nr:S46 family peptidase [Phenylobacterium sp.]MCA3741214.1 S46 family peptidase [Phenylobacterium sp.]MCA6240377.1 S46 family peptidase [Phenylobacterium sp.]